MYAVLQFVCNSGGNNKKDVAFISIIYLLIVSQLPSHKSYSVLFHFLFCSVHIIIIISHCSCKTAVLVCLCVTEQRESVEEENFTVSYHTPILLRIALCKEKKKKGKKHGVQLSDVTSYKICTKVSQNDGRYERFGNNVNYAE